MMKLGTVHLWMFLPLLSAVGPLSAQEITERAEVLAVEIPVQVIKDGVPVRGLSAEDFVVQDGRKRRPLVDFEVVDLARLAEELESGEVSLPTAAARKFLLLFDLTFSRPVAIARARSAARQLVAQRMTPLDLAAVASYSRATGVRAVLGFTSDRSQLLAAIETLGLHQPIQGLDNPLLPLIAQLEEALSFSPQDLSATRTLDFDRKTLADEIFLENLKDWSTYVGRASREALEDYVLDMTGSMEELARLLDSVPGAKQIVFFSEGFDGALLRGTADEQRSAELAEQSAQGEFWRIDSDERFGHASTRSGVYRMLSEFERAGCVIHTVDAGGLRAEVGAKGGSPGEDSLFLMASETGGTFYRNLNDLDAAMADLLAGTSYSYLLVIQPDDVPLDGSYRRLKVRLKKKIKGARLTHRQGYVATAAGP